MKTARCKTCGCTFPIPDELQPIYGVQPEAVIRLCVPSGLTMDERKRQQHLANQRQWQDRQVARSRPA